MVAIAGPEFDPTVRDLQRREHAADDGKYNSKLGPNDTNKLSDAERQATQGNSLPTGLGNKSNKTDSNPKPASGRMPGWVPRVVGFFWGSKGRKAGTLGGVAGLGGLVSLLGIFGVASGPL